MTGAQFVFLAVIVSLIALAAIQPAACWTNTINLTTHGACHGTR